MSTPTRDILRATRKRNYGEDMQKPVGIMDVMGRVASSDDDNEDFEDGNEENFIEI